MQSHSERIVPCEQALRVHSHLLFIMEIVIIITFKNGLCTHFGIAIAFYIPHRKNRIHNRVINTPWATTHASPEQPFMPPRATTHASPEQPFMPPRATMHVPPEQPCTPPQSNHTHTPQNNNTCPPEQPCMPPRATMHVPPQSNHAHPPEQPRMHPEQPCTPPGATTHTPPRTTTHAPRNNHACPSPPGATTHVPPVNRMTNRCKNITLPQTSFAGGNEP